MREGEGFDEVGRDTEEEEAYSLGTRAGWILSYPTFTLQAPESTHPDHKGLGGQGSGSFHKAPAAQA